MIIAILFLAVMVGACGYVYYLFVIEPKKTTAKRKAGTYTPPKEDISKKSTVQDQLPFENITNSMIDLGSNRYRAIIEVSSVNYELLSDDEQDHLEGDYKALINACDFPLAFIVQTKELDIREIVDITKMDVDNVSQAMPYLRNYAQEYLKNFSEYMSPRNGSIAKVKKKYIVVGSEVQNDSLFQKGKNERNQESAIQTLSNRCYTVVEGLSRCGLQADVLDTKGVIEVMFHALNNSQGVLTDGIADDSYFSQLVSGTDWFKATLTDEDITHFIDQMCNRITQLSESDKTLSPAKLRQVERIIDDLKQFKATHTNALINAEAIQSRISVNKNDDYNHFETNNTFKKSSPQEFTIVDDDDDDWIEL